MHELERAAARFGREAGRQLSAVQVERNTLKQRVRELELQVQLLAEHNAVLRKSQATRSTALQKSRQREAALLQRLAEVGVEAPAPQEDPQRVTYLGQVRAAKSLLGP